MDVRYEKARTEDYDEVIDLANYVFSHDHRPHDFPAMLPKLYKREYFTDNIHYAAREGGKIRAVVGAYPLELEFPGQSISGRGIGMVSVHPYSRSRGYMKELMKMALDDMRHDGVVFSCLSGRRQRYEYFGYGLAGSVWAFTCGEDNIRHTLGPQWSSGLSLRSVGPGDAALLDEIYALHQAKIARCKRRRDRLYEILSSWKAHVFAVTEGSRFEGYFISSNATSGEDREISEINLLDFSRLPEVLGLFLRQAPGMQGSLR
ncbi:MAG: GNAT family N-acetyltransferase, partial [Treponema sp.]|nr:GNAT family N-acetyltransferase [Treponema sp.]